jgi:hypothetical protein
MNKFKFRGYKIEVERILRKIDYKCIESCEINEF